MLSLEMTAGANDTLVSELQMKKRWNNRNNKQCVALRLVDTDFEERIIERFLWFLISLRFPEYFSQDLHVAQTQALSLFYLECNM